jgi:hypothetical protein
MTAPEAAGGDPRRARRPGAYSSWRRVMSIGEPPQTGADATRRQFQTKQRSRRGKALHAVSRDKPEAVELAVSYSLMWGSADRLYRLFPLLCRATPPVFWRIMESEWTSCDATWGNQEWLLVLMSRHAHAAPRNVPGEEAEITVYRGCSRDRIAALSWTLDEQIARGFARGHRRIAVPDPVVVVARIARADTFMFTDDRNEREVLLNPARLTDLRIEAAAA